MACDRIQNDGMRYLDGEMGEEERAAFEKHLEQCSDCRTVLNEFGKLRAFTGRIKMRDPTDEFWEGYWKSLYRRLERRVAWIFVIAGAALFLGYELYQVIRHFGEITFEKFALVVLFVGFVLLLISVIRERVHHYKVDKYKDIER
ncbi:MAG: zf-HC2 domain-containing protein [bacterium]|nr:MAG: zf-HC2 domain-containing protein [bacterium]